MRGLNDWFTVYVTRTSANGVSHSLALRWWQIKAMRVLAVSNAIAWGVVGLIEAAKVAL